MKAFRNFSGAVKEIDIDVSPNGEPLLPPDTTVDPKPDDKEGHYLTVVGMKWVYIPHVIETETFEQISIKRLTQLAVYKEWYLNSPIKYDSVLFDGDETARTNVSYSLALYNISNVLPSSWTTYNNQSYEINGDKEKFMNLMLNILQVFNNRRIEVNVIRDKIMATTNIEELNKIEVPTKPMM